MAVCDILFSVPIDAAHHKSRASAHQRNECGVDYVADVFGDIRRSGRNRAFFSDDKFGYRGNDTGAQCDIAAKCMFGILHCVHNKSALCNAGWISIIFFCGVWSGMVLECFVATYATQQNSENIIRRDINVGCCNNIYRTICYRALLFNAAVWFDWQSGFVAWQLCHVPRLVQLLLFSG